MSSSFDDRKWRELWKVVEGLAESYVQVGIVGDQADHLHSANVSQALGVAHGLTNAELAYILIYGTEDIPPRPFITQTFELKGEQLAKLQARACEGLLAGRLKLDGALALIGAWAAGAVKATVTRDGKFAPNKPETIRRKGSSRPLVDTGQLVGAVSFVVVRANSQVLSEAA